MNLIEDEDEDEDDSAGTFQAEKFFHCGPTLGFYGAFPTTKYGARTTITFT
ncbi:MAG TPA: hypothetical protein VNV43_14445 [Candidatus Acidoferrales bacterium]|nr:hypothetical protein [Candidatus Acidoferrales bacterium]